MTTSTAFTNAVTENQVSEVIITTFNSAMPVADVTTTATTYATLSSAISTSNASIAENLELAAIIGGTTVALVFTGIICSIVCFTTCFLLIKHKGIVLLMTQFKNIIVVSLLQVQLQQAKRTWT